MNSFLKTSILFTLALGCLCTPVIRPAKHFDALKDAKILFKAIDGLGTDEKTVTNIFTHRSREQLLSIAKAYSTEYKKTLYEDVKSDVSGDYLNLLIALMTPLPEYYAMVLNNAGQDKDGSEAITDILLDSSNAELNAINEAYKRLNLNAHVELPTILTRQNQILTHNMILKAFEGARNENQEVDVSAAVTDAKVLHNGEKDAVENIFVTRSYRQLRQIFEEHKRLYGQSISKTVEDRDFHRDFKRALLTMISYIESKPIYFAKRLYDSMYGGGTNEDMLIRIISTRSEIDLDEIKDAFLRIYDKTLTSWIVGDTSNDFKDALLAIVESK